MLSADLEPEPARQAVADDHAVVAEIGERAVRRCGRASSGWLAMSSGADAAHQRAGGAARRASP